MIYLRIVRGRVSGGARLHSTNMVPATVGRGTDCCISLSNATVSSTHCEIRGQDSAWTVRDLGSKSGTWLGRHRVGDSPEPLHHNARLRIGEIEVLFGAGREPDAPARPATRGKTFSVWAWVISAALILLTAASVAKAFSNARMREGIPNLFGAPRLPYTDARIELADGALELRLPGSPSTLKAGEAAPAASGALFADGTRSMLHEAGWVVSSVAESDGILRCAVIAYGQVGPASPALWRQWEYPMPEGLPLFDGGSILLTRKDIGRGAPTAIEHARIAPSSAPSRDVGSIVAFADGERRIVVALWGGDALFEALGRQPFDMALDVARTIHPATAK